MCGLIFADPVGLDLPFEVNLLYIEHILPLIGFLWLILTGRYKMSMFIHPMLNFPGWSYSIIYFHSVNWIFSELSWANISYMLCPNDYNDPSFMYMGDYYYLFGEFLWIVGMVGIRY